MQTRWDSRDRLVQLQFIQNSYWNRQTSQDHRALDLVTADSLVFPAASKPNINNLISLFPKILPGRMR